MTINENEVTFIVTEDHLAQGEQHSFNRCAGANAFYDSNPGVSLVRFGGEVLSWRYQGARYRVAQTAKVRRLIEANDESATSRDPDLAGKYRISLKDADIEPVGEVRHRKTKSKARKRVRTVAPRVGRPRA